jgi:hypothetical protein
MLFLLNAWIGLYGVVAAQPVSDGLTFICSTLIYRRVYHKLQSEIDAVAPLSAGNGKDPEI